MGDKTNRPLSVEFKPLVLSKETQAEFDSMEECKERLRKKLAANLGIPADVLRGTGEGGGYSGAWLAMLTWDRTHHELD